MLPHKHVGIALALLGCAACQPAAPPPPIDYAPLPPPTGTIGETTTQSAEVATDPPAPPQTAAQEPQDVRIGVTDGAYADTDPSALSDFQPVLSPYGTWVDDPTYGTVWVPYPDQVGSDFVPYETGGHWAYENDDYVWVSDYPWGWVPFHYGRWALIAGRGWSWIPGRAYAGAWVNWRTAPDGYLGWAPMAPAWGWRHGVAFGFGGRHEPEHFVFRRRDEVFARGAPARPIPGPRREEIERSSVPYQRPGAVIPPSHPLAQPPMHGPEPHTLGIPENHVARPSNVERERVDRARSYSQPHTAVPFGAHAPSVHVIHPAPTPVIPAPARVAPPTHVAPPPGPAPRATPQPQRRGHR